MREFLQDTADGTATLVYGVASFGVVVMCVGIALCLWRIVRGPTFADRAVGADAIGVQLIGLVAVLTVRSGTLMFVDGILILSLLSFAGTVAAAQFLARPHVARDKFPEEARP
jgi:multisubunit Na+/H+ antiporter MnhF subunit